MSYKAKMTLAKFLFFISFCLMITGLITSISENTNINLNDVIPVGTDGEEIHITESDRTPIHTGDSYSEDNKSNNPKTDNGKTNTDNKSNTSGNNTSSGNKPSSGGGNTATITPTTPSGGGNGGGNIVVPTDPNSALRTNIQNTYGITVRYGNEVSADGISGVGGLSIIPMTDATAISQALNNLNNCLSKYPSGFFREMRSGGIPLTIYLVSHFSQTGVTGVTDSNYSKAVIYIACDYSFAESFHHENFHYMERYINKLGGFFANWNRFNPSGFNYGSINDSLSYTRNGYSQDSYFVNNYAQTMEAEDRASTFEYMTANYKTSCLNYGKPIWNKANEMAMYIQNYYSTVNSGTTEFWERYL